MLDSPTCTREHMIDEGLIMIRVESCGYVKARRVRRGKSSGMRRKRSAVYSASRHSRAFKCGSHSCMRLDRSALSMFVMRCSLKDLT